MQIRSLVLAGSASALASYVLFSSGVLHAEGQMRGMATSCFNFGDVTLTAGEVQNASGFPRTVYCSLPTGDGATHGWFNTNDIDEVTVSVYDGHPADHVFGTLFSASNLRGVWSSC